MQPAELDQWHMARALELAALGQGLVEPNPLVGCVVAQGAEVIGEGWHGRFGGPHAEIEALAVAGKRAAGATLVVTLEPCCHQGKTPPCVGAIVAAGIRRVVAAMRDPFPAVAGGGIAQLQAAGIDVRVGVCENEARALNAPYLKLLARGRPWIIAKWAMTLDGKIATRTGQSRWISGEASRAAAHALRGRVDAIVVGRETVLADDPLLTARPPGPRVATRIVLDSRAALATDSQLVRTAHEVPVWIAVGPEAPAAACAALRAAGCEVIVCPAAEPGERLRSLLDELGRRRLTNVLVEGGARVLGSFFDADEVDEVHVFVAPRLFGGATAPGPVAGEGCEEVSEGWGLTGLKVERLGDDIYLHGRRPSSF